MFKNFCTLSLFALLLLLGFSAKSQCNNRQPATHGIHPSTLPDANLSEAYPPTWLTVVFRKDTVVRIDTTINGFPIRTSFRVKFTEYVIDSTGDTPSGMNIPLGTCNLAGCRYRIDTINPARNRGCLQITGTPLRAGNFRPFIRALANGSFSMPNLGPVNQFIGIPAGTVIDIASPPRILAAQIRPLRENYFRTNLRVNGGSSSSCDSRPRFQGLYPNPMPDGVENEEYPETRLTFVFRSDTTVKIDTVIQFPGAPFPFVINTSVTINFTNYQVDSAGNFPDELAVDFNSCDRPNCSYDVDKQVKENNRGCLTVIGGQPSYPNIYKPFITLIASGNFKMPNLGIPIPIPGLPPPGTEIDLANPPPLLAGFIAPFRTIRLNTQLTIKNKTTFPLCNRNVSPKPGVLQPERMPAGKVGTTYNPVKMTLDLPKDSLVVVGQGPQTQRFFVEFESFRLVGVEGLPRGMGFDIDTCETSSNCIFRVNRLDAARNRICFETYGSPAEPGKYNPLLFFQAEGTVQFFGNTFSLSNLPPQLAGPLANIRNIRFATELRVEPDKYTELCNKEIPVKGGRIFPTRLVDADSASAVPYTASLTLDLPQDTLVRVSGPGGPTVTFQVLYDGFTIERTEGLPPGMQFKGLCPGGGNTLPCKYELNNVDTARNRICFTIQGIPTKAGQFQPTVVTTAEGTVIFPNGGAFPIGNIPPDVPQNIRNAIEGTRNRRFSTNLRVKGAGVGVEDVLKEQYQLQLYPNPSNGKATLSFYLNFPAATQLKVTNLEGKIVYITDYQNLEPGKHTFLLNTPYLKQGIYFIHLSIAKNTLIQKWVIVD
ncbi:MAG: T9SS type A sorting domain-containing protein [Bacteroidia bacterium]|nr:T9SS type A sorting domain-containing protein [Bacteroidia bacterium]MDW8157474.1 T9SS type A sorting domain-containing protein [Bacteroidia bacterium]